MIFINHYKDNIYNECYQLGGQTTEMARLTLAQLTYL